VIRLVGARQPKPVATAKPAGASDVDVAKPDGEPDA